MKKLSAILFICIFAFSQYARQFNFLECKILNTLRSAALKCDCEKLAGFEKTGENRPASPKAHLHIHLDEFFAKPPGLSFFSPYPIALKAHLPYSGDEPDGIFPKPWQPPNS